MRSGNPLHAVTLAAADLGVGALLYQQLSVLLGSLLVAAGLLVLATVAVVTLVHGGAQLRRRVARAATK